MHLILSKMLIWQSFIGWYKTWVLYPILTKFGLISEVFSSLGHGT